MKSSEERASLQGSGSTAQPLHVFTDCSRTGGELHVYADHLEVHSDRGKEVRRFGTATSERLPGAARTEAKRSRSSTAAVKYSWSRWTTRTWRKGTGSSRI
jgi:hypothetical protein